MCVSTHGFFFFFYMGLEVELFFLCACKACMLLTELSPQLKKINVLSEHRAYVFTLTTRVLFHSLVLRELQGKTPLLPASCQYEFSSPAPYNLRTTEYSFPSISLFSARRCLNKYERNKFWQAITCKHSCFRCFGLKESSVCSVHHKEKPIGCCQEGRIKEQRLALHPA